MTPAPSHAAVIAHLRVERRSYIIGTLIVWAVIVATMIILIASMEPTLFAAPHATTLQQAMQRARALPPLTPQQQFELEIINLVGGVALFFLNWRFSFLLQRPRWAYASRPGGRYPAARWLWWGILALTSLFYLLLYLVPQLVLTAILARWGTQEIQFRQTHPPAPPA